MADKIFRIPDYTVSAPEFLNKPTLFPGYCQAPFTFFKNIISCATLYSDAPVIIYVLYSHVRQFIKYLLCNGRIDNFFFYEYLFWLIFTQTLAHFKLPARTDWQAGRHF
jgi:hypothetical protein